MTPEDLILLIEDDDAIARLIRLEVELMGAQVLRASSPDEAFPMLGSHQPAAIVTDLFSRSDGGKFIEEIRSAARCPLVVLSAWSSKSDELQAFAPGADAYLSKPFDPTELSARLVELLEQDRESGPAQG